MKRKQVEELVLQSLEHERGGVKVYTSAIKCAQNENLKDEWRHYFEETRTHVTALEGVCAAMGIDPNLERRGGPSCITMGWRS